MNQRALFAIPSAGFVVTLFLTPLLSHAQWIGTDGGNYTNTSNWTGGVINETFAGTLPSVATGGGNDAPALFSIVAVLGSIFNFQRRAYCTGGLRRNSTTIAQL